MGCSLSSNGLMIHVKQCARKNSSRPSVVCNSTDSRLHQNIAQKKDEIRERTITTTHSSAFDSPNGPRTSDPGQNLNPNGGNCEKSASKICIHKSENARPGFSSTDDDDVKKTSEQSGVNTTSAPRCKRFSRLDCDWNRTRSNIVNTDDKNKSRNHLPIYTATCGPQSCGVFDDEGFLAIEIKDIDSVWSLETKEDATQITSDSENNKNKGNSLHNSNTLRPRPSDSEDDACLIRGVGLPNINNNINKCEIGLALDEHEFETKVVNVIVTGVGLGLGPDTQSRHLDSSMKLNTSQICTDLNTNYVLSLSPENTNPEITSSTSSVEMDETDIYTQTSGSKNTCLSNNSTRHDCEKSTKNEQNIKDTAILKGTLQTDVEVTNLNEKSCQMIKQGTGSSGNVQYNMDVSNGVVGLDLVNFQRHNKTLIESEQGPFTVEQDDSVDDEQQTRIQESPEVCKPLENMIIHQHSDASAGNLMNTEDNQGTSPVNRCHVEEMEPVDSEAETVMIAESLCDSVIIKDRADTSEPANIGLLNCHQLMPPLKTSAAEDSESDGDSAYSYESDYFPLDAVDPHPEKPVQQEVSFHEGLPVERNTALNGRPQDRVPFLENDMTTKQQDNDGTMLDEGCLVTAWAADDYKLVGNPNRSVRGSTSNVGCQMRRGDSSNSLSSQRSQEIKWPIQHVHIDFFNDFGDCFDEEEDYGQLIYL